MRRRKIRSFDSVGVRWSRCASTCLQITDAARSKVELVVLSRRAWCRCEKGMEEDGVGCSVAELLGEIVVGSCECDGLVVSVFGW